MAKEKKLFRETAIYPIFFMVIITIIFVGVLSVLYNSQKPKIEENQRVLYYKNILDVFKDKITSIKVSDLQDNEIEDVRKDFLESGEIETDLGNKRYFIVKENNEVIGYCFDITGSGLWGTMKAVVGFAPDMQTLIDFNVYEQVETPGLGGKISEPAEKLNLRADFIDSKFFKEDGSITEYKLIADSSNRGSDNEIRQITGATITSSSFLKMLSKEMNMIRPVFMEKVLNGGSK